MVIKKICVVGCCQGAGATFISTSLAFAMASEVGGVAYIESPPANRYRQESSIADALSIKRKISGSEIIQYNILWKFREKWTDVNLLEWEEDWIEYAIYDNPKSYRGFDLIICVVDSLPSKILASVKTITHLKEYFSNRVLWILNKDYGQNIRVIEKKLGIRFDYIVPIQPQETFYKAEMQGRPLFKTKMMDEGVVKTVKNLAKYIIELY